MIAKSKRCPPQEFRSSGRRCIFLAPPDVVASFSGHMLRPKLGDDCVAWRGQWHALRAQIPPAQCKAALVVCRPNVAGCRLPTCQAHTARGRRQILVSPFLPHPPPCLSAEVAHGIFAGDAVVNKGPVGGDKLLHQNLCHLHGPDASQHRRDAVKFASTIAHEFMSPIIRDTVGG